ncbi:transmembrane amino acid transporter protein-domain-containing protein [Mucor lusitanicus]|nr:transmembrane amino acid transporter protein-domain-containing protein [Mucor lusitanicus]
MTHNNNNNIDITDKAIVNIVQQHLVHDSSTISSEDSSNHNSSSHADSTTVAAAAATTEDTNNNTSPPIDAEVPVPYHLPGAAITHDIYTHANSLVMAAHSLPRSKSFNDLKQKAGRLIHDDEVGSANTSVHNGGSEYDSSEEFENLDKPGGFRRFHIHQQHKLAVQHSNDQDISNNPAFQELFRPDSMCSAESRQDYTTGLYQIDTAGTSQYPSQPVTRHFLEYLAMTSVINQFAGEDLSDSEEDDSQLVIHDEEQQFSEETALLPNKRNRRHSAKHQKKSEHKANVTKTVFLLFKAFIGSGILFLPKAFSNGGLVFSIFTMWLMGGISLYCFLLLLDCKQHLTGSYGDMGGQLYGSWMRSIVLFSIAISQMGFMCGGTIFIVENVIEAVRALSGNAIHLNAVAVFVMLAILLMPLVLIRNIAKLSPTALLSDVLIIGGLICLLVFDFIEIFEDGITSPKSGPGIHWLFNSANYSVFIGTAVYSFEGIGLIIPIRDSMEKPEKFPAVLTFVMVLVASTLCSVGTLGYLAFGENVKTVALLNLPAGILPNSVQLGYAVAVLLSNALTLFPTIRIIEQALFGDRTGKHNLYIKWQKNTLRASIVISGTLIAWAGANDLDKFISLIGSVCCCPLSLIFPPLFHLALPTTKGSKRVIDMALIGFGTVVMLFTFYNTSKQWATSG